MRRVRLPAFALATAMVTSVVAVTAPAGASSSAENDRMLAKDEVPASFGTVRSRDFDDRTLGTAIGICGNARGRTLVSVPAPAQQFVVEIEAVSTSAESEVFQRVYQFPSASDAAAAFASLSDRLGQCNGTTTGRLAGVTVTQTVTTDCQRPDQGFCINNRVSWSGDDIPLGLRQQVVQAVYVSAGDAIVETGVHTWGRRQLTGSQSRALARLAESLSQRWLLPR